jgi:hypothetical protein
MPFYINKTLELRTGPFQKGVDTAILEAVELLLKTEKKNPYIRIFRVDYREIPPTKPGYRAFYIRYATNERDK